MNKVSTLAANENGGNIPTVIGTDLAKNVFALHAVIPIRSKPKLHQRVQSRLMVLLAAKP
jgi:hypothetical protein